MFIHIRGERMNERIGGQGTTLGILKIVNNELRALRPPSHLPSIGPSTVEALRLRAILTHDPQTPLPWPRGFFVDAANSYDRIGWDPRMNAGNAGGNVANFVWKSEAPRRRNDLLTRGPADTWLLSLGVPLLSHAYSPATESGKDRSIKRSSSRVNEPRDVTESPRTASLVAYALGNARERARPRGESAYRIILRRNNMLQ